jgi:CheY-like chemotaxis protein
VFIDVNNINGLRRQYLVKELFYMKPNVLIVDDEEIICEGLSRLLSDAYTTHRALSGGEAIDIVRENQDIDVVLCDIKLPDMDGNEVIEKIRFDNDDIKIIVMTAAASPDKVCDAMKKGANSYMRKPFAVNELEMIIKQSVTLKK